MTDYDSQLLRQAIIHARVGELDMARRYLERALDLADDRETRVQSNYWMSQIVTDPDEKRAYLEEALAYEPTHPEARRELAILDGKLKPEDIVNPDSLPNPSAETQAAQADRFTCPKCGGRMVFTPDGRSLFCEYCTRNQTLETAASQQVEQDFILKMATGQAHRVPVAVKTLTCQGCGAQFVLPPQEISAECAYCGSRYVTRGDGQLLQPDSIIPMNISQRQAVQALVEWVEKQGLRPERKVQPPRGIYLPLWTFDIVGTIPWSGYLVRNGRERERERIQGEKIIHFDDLLVPGAPKLADLLPKIAGAFDTNNAVSYDPRYLAGWPAELPQMTLAQASLEARQQAAYRARGLIQRDFDSQRVTNFAYSTATVSVATFKLTLAPLWHTLLPVEGREYRVIIDGSKGSLFCEMPPRGLKGWIKEIFGT
jgi:DNA-directed RNA polymerase subunit RPC12/RpoP